jgi:hypothetical protein
MGYIRHLPPEVPAHDRWILRVVWMAVAFVLAPQVWGQAVSATLLGNVTDHTGAAVPNAEIHIQENATGIAHTGTTNDSGNFTFPDLTPGSYTVSAESRGFKKETRANVDVVVNTTTRVDYQSLQVQLNRRFAKSLGVITSFTWGKGLGYQTGDDANLYFWIDQRHNYAPNDYDHRLNFEESLIYSLPFGPGRRWLNSGITSSVLGGWQISALVSLYSGLPFNVSANAGTINTPGQGQNATLLPRSTRFMASGPQTTGLTPQASLNPPAAPRRELAQWPMEASSAMLGETRFTARGTSQTTSQSSRPLPYGKA